MTPETLDVILRTAADYWSIPYAQAKTEYENNELIITEYPVKDLFLGTTRVGYLVHSTLSRPDFIIIIEE